MFHRSYDLSCVQDTTERNFIQTAINGVNMACSETVDAWLYVERGTLVEDSYRTLGDHDLIPKAIFTSMAKDDHTGSTFTLTLSLLQTIAQDYEGWRIRREQANSIKEGSTNLWNSWRSIKLTPYYKSMPAGGSIVSIGPILEDFLTLKASEPYSDEARQIETELMNHLGNELEKQIDILEQIVSLGSSPYCSQLLVLLKKKLNNKRNMERNHANVVKSALSQLSAAIDSRSPVALRSALNPGWYSVDFNGSELYKKGSQLLVELS